MAALWARWTRLDSRTIAHFPLNSTNIHALITSYYTHLITSHQLAPHTDCLLVDDDGRRRVVRAAHRWFVAARVWSRLAAHRFRPHRRRRLALLALGAVREIDDVLRHRFRSEPFALVGAVSTWRVDLFRVVCARAQCRTRSTTRSQSFRCASCLWTGQFVVVARGRESVSVALAHWRACRAPMQTV